MLENPGGPAHVSSSRFLAVTPPGGSRFSTMLHLTLLFHLLAFSLADQSDHGGVLDPFEGLRLLTTKNEKLQLPRIRVH
ncbi:hypothetical protein ILYODFUR_016944 [Ilyodon furcidens]|uniref:Uncharacterized protein n=1 Tax=Ilyodon furcidens TaxID=33524 RepID=A0ABV0U9X1_9TELE